jgi:anti-sigma regulatory factor (Ser/Thr protein kinase)
LSQLLSQHPGGASIIEFLLGEREAFTGPNWEQEDDTTMVIVQRSATQHAYNWQTLAEFEIASEPGNEREAMKRVAEVVASTKLPPTRVEKLKTAVAEATMNAIEHGNQNRADLMVTITVAAAADGEAVSVRIKDHALAGRHTDAAATPDLDAKLAGLQTPRGWGLFLIEKMVDKLNVIDADNQHVIELIIHAVNAVNAASAEGERHG